MQHLVLVGLVACSTHRSSLQVASEPIRPSNLPVAEPLFVGDFVDGDPFRTNTVVGNLDLSGGYVTETTEEGQYNVSKHISIGSEEKYRRQVGDWLADALGEPSLTVSPPPPRLRERRGTAPLDSKDNVSLPRVLLTPAPAESLDQAVLVPWVFSYYTHNAGWFYGQEYGTGGGARIRVLLVAYGADGEVLGYTDVDAGRISERIFSPTGPERQDLLIVLEKRVARKLR